MASNDFYLRYLLGFLAPGGKYQKVYRFTSTRM